MLGSIILEDAWLVAKQYHSGQFRKDGKTPYIVHPERVAILVEENYENEYYPTIEVISAFLHDVLEDTNCPENYIIRNFGMECYWVIKSLTNNFKSNKCDWNREQRKKAEHIRLGQCPEIVQFVKACDRIDNLRDIGNLDKGFISLYLEESYDLFNHLNLIHNTKIGKLFENTLEELNEDLRYLSTRIHED